MTILEDLQRDCQDGVGLWSPEAIARREAKKRKQERAEVIIAGAMVSIMFVVYIVAVVI